MSVAGELLLLILRQGVLFFRFYRHVTTHRYRRANRSLQNAPSPEPLTSNTARINDKRQIIQTTVVHRGKNPLTIVGILTLWTNYRGTACSVSSKTWKQIHRNTTSCNTFGFTDHILPVKHFILQSHFQKHTFLTHDTLINVFFY